MSERATTRRARVPTGVRVVREAGPGDIATVRRLDDLAFPADTPDTQPADPGELEAGVDAGDIRVLEVAGDATGYVHVDTSLGPQLYVRALGVWPDAQRRGHGSYLMDHVLSAEAELRSTPVVTVTSPRNVPMLRILFARGFAVRWALPDFFGPGLHRLGLQLRAGTVPAATAVTRVPTIAFSTIERLVNDYGLVVLSLSRAPGAPHVELAPASPGEFLPCRSPRSYYEDGEA